MNIKRIPAPVVEKLGWYVYAYIQPSTDRISYVGKGMGQRALAHLFRLRDDRVEIIAHGLKDEATAFTVECALIDGLGLDQLTNKVRGKGGRHFGRERLEDLIHRLAARKISISEPGVLIRINKLYRPDMTSEELYETTRGVWKIGTRRESLQYAFAVYHGIVREIYEIQSWHPAGTTAYRFRQRDERWDDRYEFVGKIASPAVRDRYLGGSVSHLLPEAGQNPIKYVP